MLRRILLALAVLMLVISACNGGGTRSNTSTGNSGAMLSLVPENAQFLGSLRLDELLKDEQLQNTIGQTLKDRSESKGADIQTFLSGKDDYGIDPKSIKDIVFFSTDTGVSGDNKTEDAAVLVMGKYEKEKLANSFNKESDSPLTEQPYKNIDVRASADGKNAIGFLEDDLIVVGPAKMVHAVIDVRNGDSKPLSGALPAKFQSLGSPMLKLAAVLTPDSLKGLGDAEQSALPVNTDFLTQISGLSLSADKGGDNVTFALSLDYSSNETAKKANDGISGFVSLFKSVSNDPDLIKTLESINVRSSGKSVNISGRVKTSTIQDLNKSFND